MAIETYTISGDFGGTTPNADLLRAQVTDSSITAVLDGINMSVSSEDNVDFHFATTLSAGDKTTLDDIVSTHSGAGFEFVENHELEELSPDGRLLKHSFWAHYDAGTDSFQYKVRERVYTWAQNKVTQCVETVYDINGNTVSARTILIETDTATHKRRWRRQS